MNNLIKSYTGQDKFMGHARKAASSRSLCGSAMSRVSSGNHCRSDPVQVQSTSPISSHAQSHLMSHAVSWCRSQIHQRASRSPRNFREKHKAQGSAACLGVSCFDFLMEALLSRWESRIPVAFVGLSGGMSVKALCPANHVDGLPRPNR